MSKISKEKMEKVVSELLIENIQTKRFPDCGRAWKQILKNIGEGEFIEEIALEYMYKYPYREEPYYERFPLEELCKRYIDLIGGGREEDKIWKIFSDINELIDERLADDGLNSRLLTK